MCMLVTLDSVLVCCDLVIIWGFCALGDRGRIRFIAPTAKEYYSASGDLCIQKYSTAGDRAEDALNTSRPRRPPC